ncbi:MAG: alkaline phosphatase [Planctomycetota bacterium]
MYRKEKHISAVVFLLTVVLLCLFITTSAFPGESATKKSANAFNYPDTKKEDVNDISFYQPSVDTRPFPVIRGSSVKNIIFCIGDGMGFGQVCLARMKGAGIDGKLYMERLPVVGLIKTHSSNRLVTDSAAAGTALATGFKTNNGMVGVSPEGKRYLTILEAAKDTGMATGLVVTSTIYHATPASFGAHVKSRKNKAKIAEGLLESKINVMFGGGRGHFLPKSDPNSKREDERDLISEAKKAGYSYVQSAKELKSAYGPFLLGLFQVKGLTTKAPEPSLAELTEKAIEILSKKQKGFFLMVEGSQIDWACHAKNADNAVRQTLRFDEAVKSAVDFALKDKQTIVVVTADHETGGLIVKGKDLQCKELEVYWTGKGHSGLPVAVYAFGPGAEIFGGVYDNTEVPKKIAGLLKIKSFPRVIE